MRGTTSYWRNWTTTNLAQTPPAKRYICLKAAEIINAHDPVGQTQHAHIRSATRDASRALKLADTRFTCCQHQLQVRLVRTALHSQ